MSALPRITPRATPVTSSYSALYETYPPRLTTAPEIPTRTNPLKPPPPQRRTCMLETVDPHYVNEQRSQRMKQREHYRYHNAWSKYYYGAPSEQESYRSYLRGVLKQQMTDKWATARQHLQDKIRESEKAVQTDRQDRMDDAREYLNKYSYLKSFRDDNKKLMEAKWQQRRQDRDCENRFDREQMKYNPINWSCSLK